MTVIRQYMCCYNISPSHFYSPHHFPRISVFFDSVTTKRNDNVIYQSDTMINTLLAQVQVRVPYCNTLSTTTMGHTITSPCSFILTHHAYHGCNGIHKDHTQKEMQHYFK